MTRFLALPALLVTLAACQPVVVLPTEPDGGIGDTPDTCGASGLQSLLGEHPEAVTSILLQNPYRIIRPGEAVTMDFNPERINFEVDEQDLIARIYCG
jgi:hypothetical protein